MKRGTLSIVRQTKSATKQKTLRQQKLNHRPGIYRRKKGRGFVYFDARGAAITDESNLERIRSLVIPPAWQEVWINSSPNARLQATGRDARERKQYVYHPSWRAAQERHKFRRILRFAAALPNIRKNVRRDLREEGLGMRKVLATVISLLDRSLIRVGNPEYVRQNGSFGLTTLRDNHVSISSADLDFQFKGKSQKLHSIRVRDERLAQIVRQCRSIPGNHLFQYLDETKAAHKITAADVNRYLRNLSEEEFSAKDFRTWSATVMMITTLMEKGACTSITASKRNMKECLQLVAERLGNTPAVCRKSYIHPVVMEVYLDRRKLPSVRIGNPSPKGLFKREAVAYEMLQQLMKGRCRRPKRPKMIQRTSE